MNHQHQQKMNLIQMKVMVNKMADEVKATQPKEAAKTSVADEATSPDHVFSKDELVKLLANATEKIGKIDSADPSVLSDLQKVSAGLNQAFDRVSRAGETNDNLLKTVEDYKAKIAAYAADQADRMRSEIEDSKESDIDAVSNLIAGTNDESEDD